MTSYSSSLYWILIVKLSGIGFFCLSMFSEELGGWLAYCEYIDFNFATDYIYYIVGNKVTH